MKTKALWLQGVSCNGNSHSFLNYEGLRELLSKVEFLYHPLLPSRLRIEDLADFTEDIDILVIEGAIKKEGFLRGKKEFFRLFQKLKKKAKYIVAVGNCASFGGVFKEYEADLTGVGYSKGEKIADFENLINVPGCPAHPEWIGSVLSLLCEGCEPELDELSRPAEIYSYTVHAGCLRNEYFEWKVDSATFGSKEGCLFYQQGCQAPYTGGNCNKILWNGVSSKTRAGMPCIGCTEPGFPSRDLFKTKTYMGIPARMPKGVPKRAYLTLTGVAKSFKIDRLNNPLMPKGPGCEKEES